MTQNELIDKVAAALPIQYGGKTAVHAVYEAIRKAISDELEAGGSVTMRDVGVFKVVNTKARRGLNPRTDEPMEIPSGRKVVFAAAKKLKDALKG